MIDKQSGEKVVGTDDHSFGGCDWEIFNCWTALIDQLITSAVKGVMLWIP